MKFTATSCALFLAGSNAFVASLSFTNIRKSTNLNMVAAPVKELQKIEQLKADSDHLLIPLNEVSHFDMGSRIKEDMELECVLFSCFSNSNSGANFIKICLCRLSCQDDEYHSFPV